MSCEIQKGNPNRRTKTAPSKNPYPLHAVGDPNGAVRNWVLSPEAELYSKEILEPSTIASSLEQSPSPSSPNFHFRLIKGPFSPTAKALNPQTSKTPRSFSCSQSFSLCFPLVVAFWRSEGDPSMAAAAILLRSLRRRDVASSSFSAYRSVRSVIHRRQLSSLRDYSACCFVWTISS